MKRVKWWMMLGLGALALTACSEQEELDDAAEKITPRALEIVGYMAGDVNTRMTGTTWDDGDQIGVYSDDLLTNATFTTSGDGVFTYSRNVFITDTLTHTFKAYYPYGYANLHRTCSMDATPEGQKTMDYLYADDGVSTEYNPRIILNFRRCMARVIINVRTSVPNGLMADDVFGDAEGSSITSSIGYASGHASGCILDPTTGIVKGENFNNIKPFTGWTDNRETHTRTYMVIVPPQSPFAYRHEFNNGQSDKSTYTVSLGKTKWEAGYSYTYNVTIRKDGISVANSSIEDWKIKDEAEDYTAEK